MRARTLIVGAVLIATAYAAGVATVRLGSEPAGGPAARSAAAPAGEGAAATWYTCGMHPEVVQDHPGTCPKCGMNLQPMSPDRAAAMGLTTGGEAGARAPAPAGERKILYWKSSMIPGEIHQEPGKDSMGMDLVPVYADEVSALGTIRVDPVVEQNMGVRVDEVIRGPLVKTVRTVGFVAYDETTLAAVTTKVDGWIEKLHVDLTGAQVHAGDPLFDLYSPELFSAQKEYVAALANLRGADVPAAPYSQMDSEALVGAARTRLEYFDISAEQIAALERTRAVRKTLTIRAPFTGIVTAKNVVEGEQITAGKELFRIADLSTVWIIGKVFEQDIAYVRPGQEALLTLSYVPGKTFRGRVTYVYPYLEEKTREVPVRMEFHNPGYELKPGMYASVTLASRLADEATLVPDVAVIRTGTRAVAFTVPAPGRYEAREVEVGVRAEDNYLQVLSGLAPGEKVVVSGQFLLDSESRLREAALKFLEPGKVDAATPIETTTAESAGGPAAGETGHDHEGDLYYVCPMPEHSDVLYDVPGTCPLCGMDLVPVRRRTGEVERPRITYWTCPMPGHESVREPGPGKCPLCGMTLVPHTEPPATAPASASPTPPRATPAGGHGASDEHAGHAH